MSNSLSVLVNNVVLNPFTPRNAFSTSYWHGCRLSLSTSWLQCPISDFISTLTALWFAKLISAQTWHLFWQQTFSTSPPLWFLCIVTEQVCSNGYFRMLFNFFYSLFPEKLEAQFSYLAGVVRLDLPDGQQYILIHTLSKEKYSALIITF